MFRYVGAHMHLHTSFEAFSTMRSQAFMAKKLGIEALFITDHDTRMGYLKKRVNSFSYENDQAQQQVNDSLTYWKGADQQPLPPAKTEKGWALPLLPEQNAIFYAYAKQQQASLLADLCMQLHLLLPPEQPGGLRIDFELSLKPDAQSQQHLYYDLGDCPQEDPSAFRIALPHQAGDCLLSLPLSQDILSFDPFGQDNCFISFSLRVFGPWKAFYLGHQMERKYTAEAVRQRQQALADQISPVYGVALHVATEISDAGQHKISFSQSVPLLDYPSCHYQIPWQTAAEHVKKHGGVSAFNHMFFPHYPACTEKEDQEAAIQERIHHLLETRAEGAQLLEVGFPQGRGLSVDAHLKVWDEVAMQGLLLTGYGDSDCHDSRRSWLDGNNFATFWYAENESRAALEKALPTGNAYTLDPARMQGMAFRFSLQNAPMGGLLVGGEGATASLAIENLPEAAELRLIAGGVCLEKRSLAPGNCVLSIPVEKNADICPVRAELWGADGRILLISNPVYWVKEDLPGYEARPRSIYL